VIDIPGYDIKREIGQGGMASVFLAVQTSLEREVALKIMAPALAADPAFTRRFLQEARMLASLSHPHIVQVFDVGVTASQIHYFSMQYLPGGDFATRVAQGLDEDELRRILSSIAAALGYAHQRGYVHRDVAPGNILFDANGNPVLTDFGIALAADQATRMTSAGFAVGTTHYMSPEQARGGDVDVRSDIYSLGVLAWYGLTGRPPYDGDDGFAVAYAHVFEPIPRLPARAAHWQPLIDRALAKDPAQRHADIPQFLAALTEVPPAPLDVPAAAEPVPTHAESPPRQPAVPRAASVPLRAVSPLPTLPAAPTRRRWLAPLAIGALLAGAGVVAALRPPSSDSAELPPAVPPPVSASPSGTAHEPAPPDTANRGAADMGSPDDVTAAGIPADAGGVPLDAASLPTVRDPVQELVRLGRVDLAAQRYTTPPGTNALERFRLALRIDPRDKSARQGLVETARAYLGLADKALAANDVALAGQHYERALEVAALTPEARPVADEVAARRTAAISPWLAEAVRAAKAWNKPAARAAYQRVLALDAHNEAAAQGIDRLAAIGAPGYAFRDALAGGGEGPEMVVLPGAPLAAGRFEITRAEFRRFWSEAGAREFAAKPPACRDRESLFRTSRKRDWQAPDIAQGEDHPVVCISWDEAAAYARWLSAQTGRHYRLPTSAEWDRLAQGAVSAACRGTSRVEPDARSTNGGHAPGGCGASLASTAPIGRYGPAPSGVYDIDGNVREWIEGCARAAANCRDHTVRGRAWLSPADKEPPDYADTYGGDTAANSIGLRVVRDLDNP